MNKLELKNLIKEVEINQKVLNEMLQTSKDLNENDKNYLLGKLVAYTEIRGLLGIIERK